MKTSPIVAYFIRGPSNPCCFNWYEQCGKANSRSTIEVTSGLKFMCRIFKS